MIDEGEWDGVQHDFHKPATQYMARGILDGCITRIHAASPTACVWELARRGAITMRPHFHREARDR